MTQYGDYQNLLYGAALGGVLSKVPVDFATLEARNCGKPKHAILRDETPTIVDVFRFFAGACRVMPGSAAGEYLPGYTSN